MTKSMHRRRERAPFRAAVLLLGAWVCGTDAVFWPTADDNDAMDTSSLARGMMAQGEHMTMPSQKRRRRYPEADPHMCLAFLSCCGRTDLLNHTMAGAIRHMEEDEPDWLRYEIAWVDNGSPEASQIQDSYEIEHALPLEQNTGLAMGMNLLIFNLCRAPYILLLEEDWLYLDDVIAEQTPERKRAIATALALLEHQPTSFDLRPVKGVFFRPETYGSFLTFPNADLWSKMEQVHLIESLPGENNNNDNTASGNDDEVVVDIPYQIFCSDPSLRTKYLWGSYTNGAGLYQRAALQEVGRMMGEPGDVFHDRYVESNYAYRAGLRFCHAAIQLGHCREIGNRECTAAFHHIGGGRGTRPRKTVGTTCVDDMWQFYGTPIGPKYQQLMEADPNYKPPCTKEELMAWRDAKQREVDAVEYRQEVARLYAINKAEEEKEREQMRELAKKIKSGEINLAMYEQYKHIPPNEAWAMADKLERLADSPHPLEGFYDSHGRPLKQESDIA